MFGYIALAALALTTDTARTVAPTLRIRVDSSRKEIVVTATPLSIPGATAYDSRAAQASISFTWPASGWVQGYRVDLVDSAGRILPREMMHHAAMSNLDRRQLLEPIADRVFAAGRETPPVSLPGSLGVPVTAGHQMLFYYALVNPGNNDVSGAELRVTLSWVPHRDRGLRDAFALFLDANPEREHSRTFEVPTGVTIVSSEFVLPVGGRLRALGGHLHDYGVEIRLEDVQSGKVLARLRARRRNDGRIRSVDQTRFLLSRGGLRLAANRRYRAIAVYDNPTCAPSPDGAMAFMAGLFIPDDVSLWPAVDKDNAMFIRDIANVSSGEHTHGGSGANGPGASGSGHGDHSAHRGGHEQPPVSPSPTACGRK